MDFIDLKKQQYKIDWSLPSNQVYNQIRAFDPYPGAYALFNGKRIKLFGVKKERGHSKTNVKTGQLLIIDNSLLIKTLTDCISISEVQLEGKKKISADNFIKTLEKKEYIFE